MEQGIYKIRFDLYKSGNHESDSKDLTGEVTSCETEFIYDEKSTLSETDQYSFRLLPGTYTFYHNIRWYYTVILHGGTTWIHIPNKWYLGSIWTFMLKMDEESKTCKIVFDQDSESNKVNILWMIPQYAIITIGEVLNSATGNEFVYTQVWLTYIPFAA